MHQSLKQLTVTFLAAATLGGCASTQVRFNEDRCTSKESNSLKIPLLLEFSSTQPTVYHEACDEGKRASFMTLAGQNVSGTLSPIGAAFGQNYVAQLKQKISQGDNPDYQKSCLSFYDHFLGKSGYGIESILHPDAFKVCQGKGAIRECY